MGNHEISDSKLDFFILKYCDFSRFRVFCSMMHTLSKGQIKLWGHRVNFIVIRQNV